ncbi:MAG TPA: HAMP domain-containing sensor histidine kinase [Solirubrobacteraceae bacterium]|jgi:signal transduction histidine kinase
MAVVLTLAAVVLVHRFGDRLDRTLESDLRLRARDVAALVAEARRAGDEASVDRAAGRLVQVLDLRNRVVSASPELRDRSVLSPGELRTASVRAVQLSRGTDGGVLLFARPAGPGRVVVVGVDRQHRAEALDALSGVVLEVGPVLLVVAVLAGFGVSYFALRPVERMRRAAAAITSADVAARLPVPRARDELRALGATLNDLLGRLEEALESERALVADASHELRTPLAVARAEVELALRPGRSCEELGDALGSVHEELDRLERLADDVLVLARADRAELAVERRAVRVADLVAALGSRMGAAHPGSVSTAPFTDEAAEVDVDPHRLEQAVANIVTNALRHGGRHVRLSARARDGVVELHVVDDGPGFDSELLPRAFHRFARGRDASGVPGTGLGLAIVAAIARAHGGAAGVRNVEGGGADVWISLPATTQPSSPADRLAA